MTGRQIYDSLTDKAFYFRAFDFEDQDQKPFELASENEAREFLTLYCVLKTTKEYAEYSEEKLLMAYNKISAILVEKSKISSKEFLENPKEDITYFLRGKECLALGTETTAN